MRLAGNSFFALALLLLSGAARAGGWTQPAGEGQFILTGAYYAAGKFYDAKGRERPQADYHKYELNPYLEYGYRDGLTLGANLLLQRANQKSGGRSQVNWGIGDSEFFLRQRLWQNGGAVVSVEPLLKLPRLYASSSSRPGLGSAHADAALGLSAGYDFSTPDVRRFVDAGAQYRHRLGRPEDQVRLTGSAGFGLSPDWLVMPQAFLTLRAGDPATAVLTYSSADDYTLMRLQLSALYRLTDETSLQFGGFTDADGKNTGQGRGVLVALWKRL